MSDVQNFVAVSIESSPRGAVYPSQLKASDSSSATWARTDRDVAGFATASPQKSTLPASAGLVEQIRLVLSNHYRFIGQTPRRSMVEQRVQLLATFYRELKTGGFDITDVSTFGLRHAKALLGIWQKKERSSNTVYMRWSVLRSWTIALGKQGMVGPITDYQPDFVRDSKSSKGYREFTAEEIQKRSDFLRTKPDLTHYLVDRLTREFNITRETAFEIEIGAARAVVDGGADILRVISGNRPISVPRMDQHRALMVEVRDFMLARNRKTLAWTGLDLDAAIQKYALRLSYVSRTLFSKEGSATPAQEVGGAA
jgi:hypothetical protein